MKSLLKVILLLLVVLFSCKKEPKDIPSSNYKLSGGFFILNEGNFRGGNGSVSFYSYDSSKISNDLFYSANKRPLGDVPYSMVIYEDKGYIVVNNSGKIEVVDPNSLHSTGSINGLNSPRNMAFINGSKAYVTSLYSDSLTIINPGNNTISGYINIRRTSEAIVVLDNKVYVSNWTGGKEIMVINTLTDRVSDSIPVGNEPESMVLDKNRTLWVLCNGGWARENFAKLVQINTSTDKVLTEYTFPSKQASPTCLKIDAMGQTLFYLENGIKVMDIGSGKLPPTALIADPGASFYKLAINPGNGDIIVTDAVDYTRRGYVNIYKKDGTLITQEEAGIIPGSVCFKLRLN
jgi:YVTN family beta-propeller protein